MYNTILKMSGQITDLLSHVLTEWPGVRAILTINVRELQRQRPVNGLQNSMACSTPALASAKARSLGVEGTLQIISHADFMAEKLPEGLVPLQQAGSRFTQRHDVGKALLQTQQ